MVAPAVTAPPDHSPLAPDEAIARFSGHRAQAEFRQAAPAIRETQRGWLRYEPLIFGLGVFALLVPLWSFHYFPSQDGPLHLYNAVAFRDYHNADRPMFRRIFRQNTEIVPNWVAPHALPVLLRFLEPELAEKLLFSLYLIAFPLAVRYCLKSIRPSAAPLSLAALAWVPNQFYHMGFEDFCLSLPLFFLTLGYFLRHRRGFGYLHGSVLAALLLLTYITHLLSAAMVLPVIGMVALFEAWPMRRTLAGRVRALMPMVLAMVPVTAVALYFLLQPHPTTRSFEYPKGWAHRFYFIISWMRGLGWLDLIPDAVVVGLFIVVSIVVARRLRRVGAWSLATRRAAGGLLAATALFLAAFLLAPDYVGGGAMILVRLAAYPLFLLPLWWAAVPLTPGAFRRLQTVVAAVTLPALAMMLALDCVNYRTANRYLADFSALAAQVEPNSTLLPVRFEDDAAYELGSPQRRIAVGVDPFRHAASFGLGERGVVNLGNDWASTDHQSLRWQPGLNPFHDDLKEPEVFESYTRRTGIPIDYVVLWTGGAAHNDLEGRAIRAQLGDYTLIYRSSTDGYLELYRHNPPLASSR